MKFKILLWRAPYSSAFPAILCLQAAWILRSCFVLFVLLKPCSCTAYRVDGRLPTGGSPVATPFLCFAKEKEAKERLTACRCPFGVPDYACQKMGNVQNSLRSDMDISDPFSAPHNRQRHKRKFQSQSQNQQQQNIVDQAFADQYEQLRYCCSACG